MGASVDGRGTRGGGETGTTLHSGNAGEEGTWCGAFCDDDPLVGAEVLSSALAGPLGGDGGTTAGGAVMSLAGGPSRTLEPIDAAILAACLSNADLANRAR